MQSISRAQLGWVNNPGLIRSHWENKTYWVPKFCLQRKNFDIFTCTCTTQTSPQLSLPLEMNQKFPFWRSTCNSGAGKYEVWDGWIDGGNLAAQHMEYHILLFSLGSLLLPVVGLNKMGPERRTEGGELHQSCALFRGSTFVCEKCHSS